MNLNDFLCQSSCYFCGQPLPGDCPLCDSCIARLSQSDLYSQRCQRCSYPFFKDEGECAFCHILPDMLESLYALNFFRGVHKELVHLYKAGKLKNLRFYYAKRIHEVLRGFKGCQNTFIVPVPPRKGKLRRQGWDQISLLARTLHITYGYKITPVLTRLDSVQQKYLSLDERRHHLIYSMKTVKNAARSLEGAGRLILLDDVLTSGATLTACANLLKDCSPAPVMGMVLCAVL